LEGRTDWVETADARRPPEKPADVAAWAEYKVAETRTRNAIWRITVKKKGFAKNN